jgi:hypothetical protein
MQSLRHTNARRRTIRSTDQTAPNESSHTAPRRTVSRATVPYPSPLSRHAPLSCTSAASGALRSRSVRCGTKMRARTAMRRRASACRWSVSAAVCARSCALCSRAAALDIRIPLGCELYYNLLAAQARPPRRADGHRRPATHVCAMLLAFALSDCWRQIAVSVNALVRWEERWGDGPVPLNTVRTHSGTCK